MVIQLNFNTESEVKANTKDGKTEKHKRMQSKTGFHTFYPVNTAARASSSFWQVWYRTRKQRMQSESRTL